MNWQGEGVELIEFVEVEFLVRVPNQVLEYRDCTQGLIVAFDGNDLLCKFLYDMRLSLKHMVLVCWNRLERKYEVSDEANVILDCNQKTQMAVDLQNKL